MSQPPKRPTQAPFIKGGFQTQVPNGPRTGREGGFESETPPAPPTPERPLVPPDFNDGSLSAVYRQPPFSEQPNPGRTFDALGGRVQPTGAGYGGGGYGIGPLGYGGAPQGGPGQNVVNPARPGPGPLPQNISNAVVDVPSIAVQAKVEDLRVPQQIVLDAEPAVYKANSSDVPPPREAALNVTMDNFTLNAKATVGGKPKKVKRLHLRDKKQVFIQSRVLIVSLEDAISYDPQTQHNQQQPELYVALGLDKPGTRIDVKALIDELKRLNELLESARAPTEDHNKTVIDLRKHLNSFLNAIAISAGTGAGLLILGVASSLLYHIGGKEVVDLALQWKPK